MSETKNCIADAYAYFHKLEVRQNDILKWNCDWIELIIQQKLKKTTTFNHVLNILKQGWKRKG